MMNPGVRLPFGICGMFLCALLSATASALEPPPYRAILPSMAEQTVVLTGHDLTIDQVVQVARYGAQVALSPEARQRSADAHALLLEAAAEGVSVYWFNRGSGSGRERFIFKGDPLSPENKKLLEARQLAIFRRGALAGLGPEISEEEIVRAMLVVRANTMSFEAASPQLTQRLLDLLNDRITPVVQSRGTVGEGDLGPFTNVGATMVGAGNAYYRGVRMPAAEALQAAGLAPLAPFGADAVRWRDVPGVPGPGAGAVPGRRPGRSRPRTTGGSGRPRGTRRARCGSRTTPARLLYGLALSPLRIIPRRGFRRTSAMPNHFYTYIKA